MDVKITFLYGDLKEEVYMFPPPGMFTTRSSNVCSLRWSIYRLNNLHIHGLKNFESLCLIFSLYSQYDSSLFLHKTSTKIVLFLIYVDNIFITDLDSKLIREL